MNGCLAVVVLVLLGLPGMIQAAPVVVESQVPDDGSESITVMDETVVAGSFVDPFDSEERESVYDPWEPFNVAVFDFNYGILDRYAMKPGARLYDAILPEDVQNSLGNAFYNLGVAPRLLNNALQGKFSEVGEEMQRFLLNSTLGVAGLFDVATHMFGMEMPPTEDTGQTLAVYGVPPGPYVILPLFPPMTVRGLVGRVGDMALSPVNYFLPFFPNMGFNAAERLNFRARNIERFEGIEASTLDLYGATRTGYLDRRARDVQE